MLQQYVTALKKQLKQSVLRINFRLLTVKKTARSTTADPEKEIAKIQRIVEESVQSMTRFGHSPRHPAAPKLCGGMGPDSARLGALLM